MWIPKDNSVGDKISPTENKNKPLYENILHRGLDFTKIKFHIDFNNVK